MVELKGIAIAMLVVAGLGALQLPAPGSKLSNGTDQTYWWCEMHHAPQNIQTTVGGAISQALFGPPALAPNARKENIIDASTTTGPISTSTQMVMMKRPTSNNYGDPQEATFWCEMHATGASHLQQKQDAQESIKKAVGGN